MELFSTVKRYSVRSLPKKRGEFRQAKRLRKQNTSKGELAFSIEYLYLPNGNVIKLRNQVEKNLNGSGVGVAAGAILLTPLALFVRGKNAKYVTGDIFTAYVD